MPFTIFIARRRGGVTLLKKTERLRLGDAGGQGDRRGPGCEEAHGEGYVHAASRRGGGGGHRRG